MTERIYSDEDLSAIRLQCYEAGRLGKEAYTVRGGGEVVVRCRDCAMYDDGDGMCMRDPEHTGRGWYTRPDGFCAWASRREDGQCRTLR